MNEKRAEWGSEIAFMILSGGGLVRHGKCGSAWRDRLAMVETPMPGGESKRERQACQNRRFCELPVDRQSDERWERTIAETKPRPSLTHSWMHLGLRAERGRWIGCDLENSPKLLAGGDGKWSGLVPRPLSRCLFYPSKTSSIISWRTLCARPGSGLSRWSFASLSAYARTMSGRTFFIAAAVCISRRRTVRLCGYLRH